MEVDVASHFPGIHRSLARGIHAHPQRIGAAALADQTDTRHRAVQRRLHDRHTETVKVLQQPAVVETLKPLGAEPMPLTPKEFDAMIAKEIQTNIAVAKAAGLKFN